MEDKFLNQTGLSKFLEKCSNLFARKSVENQIVDVAVSKEQPQNQKIGDVWFAKTGR